MDEIKGNIICLFYRLKDKNIIIKNKSNISTILQMFSSLSIVVKDLNNKIMEINKNDNILMKMDHPNIVKIFGFYITKNYYYLITEYCEGGSFFHFFSK